MNLGKLDLFRMASGKMGWLNERQTVLAQNIANADTPGYHARDLKPQDFSRMLSANKPINVSKTSAGHIEGTIARNDFRITKERNRDVYEVNPNKNAVVMEEQLMKVSESNMNYKLASNIYKKNLSMFKLALGVAR
ncbi:MAG: flagellar basal-body rod protein FlgB [Rhodospirillaceae bacterium]|nr:flagellar basal-body rod protein FlgB [Rhodospirillaceae bacterium]|tara:strand:- start:2116 stop:2523 length:408 start_codon:yes stop_codon:yes gene_type:complete